MWNLQTLDGCFEGAQPWDLDFHNAAWGDELARFSLDQEEEEVVGTLLFGRTTYRNGSRLFKPGGTPQNLNLLEAQPLAAGAIILRYAPQS